MGAMDAPLFALDAVTVRRGTPCPCDDVTLDLRCRAC